jgi:hypothetical protein
MISINSSGSHPSSTVYSLTYLQLEVIMQDDMQDFKKRLSIPPPPSAPKFYRIDGLVFPEHLIREGGYDPKQFEECGPPDQNELLAAVERARKLKVE